MPQLGFGVFQMSPEEAEQSVIDDPEFVKYLHGCD
jgi:hypothetical protein